MSRKLLLINPVSRVRRGLGLDPLAQYPPLALGIVAALTPSDWDIEIFDENLERFRYREADLVGLTSPTAFITRAYEIAAIYHERGIPTVIGGVHASMLPEEALEYVDSVAIGDAESTWPRVIEDFENGGLKSIYRGDPRAQTGMCAPRHDLFHPGYIIGAIQTARGCPMDCHFCSVPALHGRKYRQRDVEAVLDELETIPQKVVCFVDDNLYGYGADASRRALTLFKGIIDRKIKKYWFSQASINFADDDEVLEYAAKSGCRMVLLGLEAENAEALEDTNKKLNLKFLDRHEEIFRRINTHGIAVLGSFIYGMEPDTPEALSRRTEYILDSDVDAIQISLMTPLPGTRLFQKLQDEGRLLYTNFPDDWDHYDVTEIVFKPLLMEPQELFDGFCKGGMKLYNPGFLWYKYIKTLITTRSPITAAWAYSANLQYFFAGTWAYLQRMWLSL